MTIGLTQDPDEIPRPEARDESVSPETYLELAREFDNHTPRAGVIPFVFDLLASSADVASIFERVVRIGGPMPQSKMVKDRVLRDLGPVVRNVVQIAAFFGFSLRDVIDADAHLIDAALAKAEEKAAAKEAAKDGQPSALPDGASTGS